MPYATKYVSGTLANRIFTSNKVAMRRSSAFMSYDGTKGYWDRIPTKYLMLVNIKQGLHRKGKWVSNIYHSGDDVIQVDIEDGKLTFLHGSVLDKGVRYSFHEEEYDTVLICKELFAEDVYSELTAEEYNNDQFMTAFYWERMIKPWYRPGGTGINPNPGYMPVPLD